MAVRTTFACALALLTVFASGSGACAETAPKIPRVAFFGFHLINTSLEPVSAIEDERISNLDRQLRERLDQSGRFAIVEVTPAVRSDIEAGPWIGNCNGCETGFAKALGSDLAVWGTVQKVSNLILNINLYMRDVETGRMTFVHSVDIRGNTDVSWRRGLDYLLQHYLLPESPLTSAPAPG
ncbi:DUF3280 domain-containing protein [Methylocapsa palsarum]|uniref:DUF2380 domain-containing protein n=1 Tax=Methylocapsa palsarum TaxID=1612308 RepID=A0A1I3Z2H9_9HYPH|nr:DUF3280 domain-containing protein [Methylocapsa palsarum]SFK38245.1 Protein of unknown function [Methylocapsa palsarum]